MKMTIRVTNHNLPPALFNQICFMLQLAGPCDKTKDGVVFSDINANDPVHLPGGSATIVTAETYYRFKIRELCARCCGWFGRTNIEQQIRIGLQIYYTDIEPKLFCADMITDQTEGYPTCQRKDCPKKNSCWYASEQDSAL